jgi:hypothetical protein
MLTKKVSHFLDLLKRANWLKIHPSLYLTISLLLSLAITGRFFLPVNPSFQIINLILYVTLFLLLPTGAMAYLLILTLGPPKKRIINIDQTTNRINWKNKILHFHWPSKWKILAVFFLALWAALLVAGFRGATLPYPYFYLWIPFPLAYLLSIKRNKDKERLLKSKLLKIAIVCLVIAIVVPNLVVFVGTSQIIDKASSFPSVLSKISYLDDRVNALTEYTYCFRAELDGWQFLLSGAGQCGEMATTTNNLMQESGLKSRIVTIPGEHQFTEVNVNGTWLVADGSSLINENTYGQIRTADPGSLSYAIVENSNSFIEVTTDFVPTDTIIINVTRNGEPVADASVILVRSGTLSAQLPDMGLSFHTNVNGLTTLHLGKANFVGKYKNTNDYYVIYVNGSPTKYTVTSTGTGKTSLVNVELK